MARLSATLLAALLTAIAVAQAPQQPIRAAVPAPASSADWKLKRRVVVTIGIDRYKNWPRLGNAVSDASEVAQVFRAAGFLEIVPPLLNEAADKKSILHLIETQLADQLEDSDDLVLFFAGHGASKKSKVGGDPFTSGYLIPADASNPERNEWSDYLPLGELLESIGTLPPRHVLLILDSCRSGVALGRVVEMSKGDGVSAGPASASRMVITSAGADQDASDAGPVPGHSLFTGLLLQGLKSGDADLDKDGQITDAELALYLKSQMRKARGLQQIPNYGQFLADNHGEMSFPKPVPVMCADGVCPLPPPSTDIAAMRGPKRAVRQAIVIGCDDYRKFPLHYAVADAREVGHAFESLGYEVSRLENPTRAQVEQAVRNAVESASSSLGSLTFFFAGFGTADDSGNRYLALSDFDSQDIRTTGLNYDDLQSTLLHSAAQQKVFFIDAQFVGSSRAAQPAYLSRDWATKSSYATLLATSRGQGAIEHEVLGHGVFSYFLIRGLRGAAAADDGVIAFGDLGDYVRANVALWTERHQTPVMSASDAGYDFPLGVVRAGSSPLPPIPPSPGFRPPIIR